MESRCYTLETDRFLDAIEVIFAVVSDNYSENLDDNPAGWNVILTPTEAAEQVNRLFGQYDLGYSLVDGQIVPVKSEYMHTEIVEPTINLLVLQRRFTGAGKATDAMGLFGAGVAGLGGD